MKSSWSWLLGMLISAGALLVIFWGIHPADLLNILQNARYVYLLPATVMLVLGLLTRAKSWHTLLGRQVPYRRAFHALNSGYLLNNVLPFRLGELGRAYLVSRGQTLSGTLALSTVILERLIDLTVSVSVLLASLPFVLAADWARNAVPGVIVLVAAMYAALFLLLRHRSFALHWMERLLDRIPWLHTGLWTRRAGRFVDGLEPLRDGRRLFLAFFWSSMAWATYAFQIWFLMQAFLPAPPLPVVGFLLGVTAIGAAVPSSPGAVGVFEAAVVAGLLAFDYARPEALSFAVTLHLSALATTSLFGAFALASEGESLLTVARSARAYFRSARGISPVME